MNTTVIHHSADYDGIFCREIARKFLPDATFIGWDFADKPLTIPEGNIYVMDLPVDRVFGLSFTPDDLIIPNLTWLDHHKSSIANHPIRYPGYRIDGVAACRLAWQWFAALRDGRNILPTKEEFLSRTVYEPLAVRLAGEYDIWDHRGDGDLEFQFGLDSRIKLDWDTLLGFGGVSYEYAMSIVHDGAAAMRCYAKRDADVMRSRSFITEFEGLRFLVLNTARCNSNTFAALDVPETGHDALLAFTWTGEGFTVSLYHAKHCTDLDLSLIAVKHGGGGHRGACGFRAKSLPFVQ